MKKIISLLFCALMLCALALPLAAAEEVPHNHTHYVDHIVREGNSVKSFGLFCEDCDEVKHVKTGGIVIDYSISYNGWGADGEESWYFIDGLVSLKDPLRISGTVNLVLLDDSLFICETGLHLMEGATLNVYSEHIDYSPDTRDNHMGRLRAYARGEQGVFAAIGGGWKGEDTTVNIYGGDVYAFSEGYGAAIGSGHQGKSVVNVYGGKIRAFSTGSGAGIGSGYDYASATVSFYGGITWASSAEHYAASVGCGFWECHADVNFHGGYVYGVPNTSEYSRTAGIVADHLMTFAEGTHALGQNDGLYDVAAMDLAKQAGWIERNGGYVASTLSGGTLWIVIGVAALAAVGVAVAVVIVKKKKRG